MQVTINQHQAIVRVAESKRDREAIQILLPNSERCQSVKINFQGNGYSIEIEQNGEPDNTMFSGKNPVSHPRPYFYNGNHYRQRRFSSDASDASKQVNPLDFL